MPIEKYKQKRDFAKTPEPAGSVATAPSATGGGRFVVQRHRATRLHYDFRLEIGGVLASWAVPRGPTLDPGTRRMAVHVEDHPIEYFDFEGVIPKGQYGAGDVIVWDWGTWTPEPGVGDPAEAVAAGELKFSLQGEKLRGRFTIVRTSGRGGDAARRAFEDASEQWLLIHKRDEHSLSGWDAEDHPRSVKSGRTNDEVKVNADALWNGAAPAAEAEIDLAAAVEAPFPGFVQPMAATLASKAFRDEDWLFEIKWDGYRIEALVEGGRVRLFTRHGNEGETYFPGFLSPPTWIDAETAIVDGEVVALDDAGRPDFGLLQERISALRAGRAAASRARADAPGALVYQAFDLLYLNGRSLLLVPLEDRKRLLRTVLRHDRRVRYASHVEAEGLVFHAAATAQGLEGVVAKHRRSRYEPGRRAATWLKVKIRPEQELVVGGWTPGEGNAKDLGAVIVGVYEGDRLRYAGKVGSGFNGRTRLELRERLGALAADVPAFDPPPPRVPELRAARWTRPELVIRAELGGWSRDDLVRQTAFKGIEEGRDPRDVVRERAVPTAQADREAEEVVAEAERQAVRTAAETEVAMPRPKTTRSAKPSGARKPTAAEPALAQEASSAELEALAALGKEGVWRVGGHDLKLTNLDKALFPPPPERPDEPPITKRELIAYFARIAPAMLPHLAERALNLHRFPNGVGGASFWQKDIPSTAPDWLRRWRETGVAERDANLHLVADRVAALCWLGNQAAFEVHAWTSPLDDPAHPTFALIDIDPGEKTTWDETLQIARLYRAAFEHLGVRVYPKLTGKRGIQAWLPVERGRYTFKDTSDWVEQISRAVGAMVPDLVSWEWAKEARKGRARLDYTQNQPIKTLVAPYAVRPLPGAPVSAPIRWDELDDPDLRPTQWTIRTVVDRVAQVGDLFAGAQTDPQELPRL